MTERITRDQLQRERLKRKSEAEVQREIRAHLRGRPYTITDATLSLNVKGQRVARVIEGWPDITTITKGARMFVIEVKRPVGGRLRREQALRLRQLHNAGVLVCVARSVEDVQRVETLGVATPAMLDEINRAIAKPVKTGLESKPIDESVGF